jgi:hypothetical protein
VAIKGQNCRARRPIKPFNHEASLIVANQKVKIFDPTDSFLTGTIPGTKKPGKFARLGKGKWR